MVDTLSRAAPAQLRRLRRGSGTSSRRGAAWSPRSAAWAVSALTSAEDIWYPGDPTRSRALGGAQVIVNINGSPTTPASVAVGEEMLAGRAGYYGVAIVYTNQVGGQDELVFDGGSMVSGPTGEAARLSQNVRGRPARLRHPRGRPAHLAFEHTADAAQSATSPSLAPRTPRLPPPGGGGVGGGPGMPARIEPELPHAAEVYTALVTGDPRLPRQDRLPEGAVALSEGIDSSPRRRCGRRRLGAENVSRRWHARAIRRRAASPMPASSRATSASASSSSPIEPAHAAYLRMLERPFHDFAGDHAPAPKRTSSPAFAATSS